MINCLKISMNNSLSEFYNAGKRNEYLECKFLSMYGKFEDAKMHRMHIIYKRI